MALPTQLCSRFDRATGEIAEAATVARTLRDLEGYFADAAAYRAALAQGNPLLYTVAAVEPDQGDGALHYGIGRLLPGRIGAEYYMTKGHFHAWRPAAEYYIGLQGTGAMLLEDESGRAVRLLPLTPDSAVYVPGHTAHRTINTGEEPLIYLGIYPARAGHEYGVIAERNFRHVVVERAGLPTLVERGEYVAALPR